MFELFYFLMALTGVIVWLFVLFIIFCAVLGKEVHIKFGSHKDDKEDK